MVGDSLVTANVRIYRRKGEHELDTTMIMTHRFTDGRVTHGTDMCPAEFEQFWADAGITL